MSKLLRYTCKVCAARFARSVQVLDQTRSIGAVRLSAGGAGLKVRACVGRVSGGELLAFEAALGFRLESAHFYSSVAYDETFGYGGVGVFECFESDD